MARGTSQGDSNLKLFFLKITGLKENEKARIEQVEAGENGKHIKLDETVPDVSGQIHKIEVRDYVPREGETAQELKIWLKDVKAGEIYAVGCNMNSISRSIMNTLLNLEEPYGELMIRVYNKKEAPHYAAVYITHNGAKVGWKYSLDEQKKFVTENSVTTKGITKIVRDYWNLEQFLIKELREKFSSLSSVPSQFQDSEVLPPPDVLEPASSPFDEDLPDFLKA